MGQWLKSCEFLSLLCRKPKYPIKAKTPASVVYEYYTPGNRAEAKPVELVVEEKK